MNRWHQLKNAIEQSELCASDRSVFRDLLDHGHHYATAEPDPGRSPSAAMIARRTGLSRRQVVYSLRHLRRHGWVKPDGHVGREHRTVFELLPGAPCDCTGRRHVAVAAQPGASVAAQPDEFRCATTAHLGAQRGCATPQVNGQFPEESTKRVVLTCTTDKRESPQNGDPVTCQFCGASGVVGVRLIDHDPGCRGCRPSRC